MLFFENDIDSLLDSMFRNGKLNFGSAQRRSEQTQEALEQVSETGDNLSRSLQDSIEQLTRQARADMEALDSRLQEEGLKKKFLPEIRELRNSWTRPLKPPHGKCGKE